MSAIVVKRLRRSYGDVTAVRDVTFRVEVGEVVALLGPNGAGKTTIVEILEGYRHRDGGRIEVLGADPAAGGRRFRERIGVVLQQTSVEPFLTVRESLRRHAALYPRPRDPDEVLRLVGLVEQGDRPVRKLSGGQQRRLDLALGLVGNPELLFLDEPTTGFDPSARRGAWELVRQLRGTGMTILLTTHYMDEAQALADRVVVVAAGEVVADAAPDVLGGRADAAATIRFGLPGGLTAADLPVPVESLGDGRVQVETATPTAVLAKLTAWAHRRKLELPGLVVTRPTLEDAYLELTGAEEAE